MTRGYIARNGNYRADALLHSAYRAVNDAAAGTDWLIDLVRAAPNPTDTLASIAKAAWLPVRSASASTTDRRGQEEQAAGCGTAQTESWQVDTWRLLRIRSLVTQTDRAPPELLRALDEARLVPTRR